MNSLRHDEPGSSSWAREVMLSRAENNLACPRGNIAYEYIGPLAGTTWHRHAYAGCGQLRTYWTACTLERCDFLTDGLEGRASLDFNCPQQALVFAGAGNSVRASGCGQSAVYMNVPQGWVRD